MPYIHTSPTPYSVAQFVRWYREKSLDLSPEFQRRAVWKPGAKAFLIDTILNGLPIPPLYLRELPTDQETLQTPKQVVDGQQRLRTVIAFVDPHALRDFDLTADSFTLSGAHNEKLAGLVFKQLPKELRQQILDYQFIAHTFDAQISDNLVFQIFSRMNSTGVKLNKQELRNADYFGYFKSVAYKLAAEQLRRWVDWGIFTQTQIARMDEVELSSDLLNLIMNGITAKTPKMLNDLYEKYDKQFPKRLEAARRFQHIFDVIEDSMPNSGLGALAGKTLFYAGFGALYQTCFGLGSPLLMRKPHRIGREQFRRVAAAADRIERGEVAKAVKDASSVRVTHAAARKKLIAYLSKAFNG